MDNKLLKVLPKDVYDYLDETMIAGESIDDENGKIMYQTYYGTEEYESLEDFINEMRICIEENKGVL